jgi:hypothetical protein
MGKIDDLIDSISGTLASAAIQKDLKAELAAFLQKARSAADNYTVHKHRELVKRWEDQDKQIADLITSLKAQPGWEKGLSEICPALFEPIAQLKLQLAGTKAADPPDEPALAKHGLYWKRIWQLGNRDSLKRAYEQQKLTLAAWENPAQSLEKILSDDASLIDEARKTIGQQPAPTLPFDLFVKLVPTHLHIKPPAGKTAVLPIDGVLPGGEAWKVSCSAAANWLLKEKPSLIEPKDYPAKYEDVLQLYNGAVEKLAAAESELKKTEDAIERSVRQIAERLKSADKDAKAALQA